MLMGIQHLNERKLLLPEVSSTAGLAELLFFMFPEDSIFKTWKYITAFGSVLFRGQEQDSISHQQKEKGKTGIISSTAWFVWFASFK